jgi:hypothetical protein
MSAAINHMKYDGKDIVWSILLIFGSFCIGYNLAIACHELGHALAMVLDGVGVREFHLNPFSWSWTFPRSLKHELFTASGGITFGLLLALIPLVLTIRIRSPYFRIPAFMTAGFALSINGIYLVAGVFFRMGDGGELIQYGIAPMPIVLLGGLYLIGSLVILAVVQPELGIGTSCPFTYRFFMLASGITPYLLIIFVYNRFLNQKETLLWLSFALAGVFLVFLISVAGHFRARRLRISGETHRSESGWKFVVVILVAGVGVVLAELLFFGIKLNPF